MVKFYLELFITGINFPDMYVKSKKAKGEGRKEIKEKEKETDEGKKKEHK